MDRSPEEGSLLQGRIATAFKLDGEKAFWILLLVLAVITRFWDLGTRAYNHDETTHALYAWKLYRGEGYRHDPMSHGPFLFHITAAFFTLFGDDDFTGRASAASFGVLVVMLPLILRRELGKAGAAIAGFLFLISPLTMYFSRFIRNDIYCVAWDLLLVFAFFRYLEKRQSRYLYLGAAVLTLYLSTKEVAYIFGFITLSFIGCALVAEMRTKDGLMGRTIKAIRGQELALAIGIALAIYTVLYSTVFSELSGLGTGIVGSIVYWLAQHGVQRGNQPWFYYPVLLAIYEYLPVLAALVGLGWWFGRCKNSASPLEGHPYFLAFLLWWAGWSLVLFSWAGEKMPWLGVHLSTPFILLAAFTLGRYFQERGWRWLLAEQGWLPGALLIPAGLLLALLLRWGPSSGGSLAELGENIRWLGYLGALVLFIWLITHCSRRLGKEKALASLGLGGLAFLSALTLRGALTASFIHRELPTETLIYAQGARDLKDLVALIEGVGQAMGQGHDLPVAYDGESSWPIEWYLRDYKNKRFLGQEVSGPVDAAIIMVDPGNEEKLLPYVEGYTRKSYARMWWASEDYRKLTFGRALSWIMNREQRATLWDIFFLRRYPYDIGHWPYRSDVVVYIRPDVAQKLWPWEILPAAKKGASPEELIAALKIIPQQAELVWGKWGTGPGELNMPKDLAIGPDGQVYVADAGNHRIQVFSPEGQYLRSWGASGSAPGEFKEPWGIGIDGDGRVYVADTWNHRIQVFTPQGEYLATWGKGELTSTGGEARGGEDIFYGPRDILEVEKGKLCISDTGNKRIVCRNQEGTFLSQWGGTGKSPGRFLEPVGLAASIREDRVYVADAWNQRVQAFGTDFSFLQEWPVAGWKGQAAIHKPYLAVDEARGRIYASDPAGNRILVYDTTGELVEAWDGLAPDGTRLNAPTGLACDQQGRVYVADSLNHRILRFDPTNERTKGRVARK